MYCADVLQLSGAQRQLLKRYGTSGFRHVIPRRSLLPRLVVTWSATLIMAVSPFVWYYTVTSGDDVTVRFYQSKIRKLALCVFMLSFAMPLLSALVGYGLWLRTWMTSGNDR